MKTITGLTSKTTLYIRHILINCHCQFIGHNSTSLTDENKLKDV